MNDPIPPRPDGDGRVTFELADGSTREHKFVNITSHATTHNGYVVYRKDGNITEYPFNNVLARYIKINSNEVIAAITEWHRQYDPNWKG